MIIKRCGRIIIHWKSSIDTYSTINFNVLVLVLKSINTYSTINFNILVPVLKSNTIGMFEFLNYFKASVNYCHSHFFGYISWRWNGKKRAGWFSVGFPQQKRTLVYQLNTNVIFVTCN